MTHGERVTEAMCNARPDAGQPALFVYVIPGDDLHLLEHYAKVAAEVLDLRDRLELEREARRKEGVEPT